MAADGYDPRPPELEAAFAALPLPDADDYLDRLCEAPVEVVVRSRREAPDEALRAGIDSLLVARVLLLIRNAVRRHVRPPDDEVEDVENEAMSLLWARIIRNDPFAERRFNLFLKRIVQQAGKRIRGGRQRERERTALTIGMPDPAARDGDAPLDVADGIDAYARAEARMDIEDALASIGPALADVLILHYLEGFPLHSQNPDTETVASMLGLKERTVHRRHRDGRDALRRALEQGGDDG